MCSFGRCDLGVFHPARRFHMVQRGGTTYGSVYTSDGALPRKFWRFLARMSHEAIHARQWAFEG